MRFLNFLLLIFCSCNSMTGQENCCLGVIKFEYAGEDIDKPIRSIFITANQKIKNIDANQVDLLYVSNETYKAIENFVKAKQSKIESTLEIKDKTSLGLLCSIEEGESDIKYLLLTRYDAVQYLNELKRTLKDNEKLKVGEIITVTESFDIFINRINW